MADEREEPSGLKIIDKRRFTESGETRPNSPESVDNVNKRDADRNPAAKQQSNSKAFTSDSAREVGGEQKGRAGPEVDFSSFIVSIATQALASLGEIDHAELRQVPVNLDAAKQMIDILIMLEEKTKGNLGEDETKLVADVLASLRLAFVKKMNQLKK